MLIQFTVGNFLSFKENKTFSMLSSTSIKEKDGDFKIDKKNRLLNSAMLYGANASGKSNFVKALWFSRNFILNSVKNNLEESILGIENFRLSTVTKNKPSYFEFVFLLNEKVYRYGFELDTKKIHSEWMFVSKTFTGKESKIFTRESQDFDVNIKYENLEKHAKEETNEKSLLLTVTATLDQKELRPLIVDWFRKFNVISGLQDSYGSFTRRKVSEDKEFKKEVLKFLKTADLDIDYFDVEEDRVDFDSMPDELKAHITKRGIKQSEVSKIVRADITTYHKKYDKNNKEIEGCEKFLLDKNESDGTSKIFNLSGPVLDTLMGGKVLIIDELDTSLHSKMTEFIINLFVSKKTNPNNAQLIFITHDTNLLNLDLVRRDQIWFAEKNKYGATDLYSLLEYKPRKDASLEKGYMMGRYGAIPCINFEKFEIKK